VRVLVQLANKLIPSFGVCSMVGYNGGEWLLLWGGLRYHGRGCARGWVFCVLVEWMNDFFFFLLSSFYNVFFSNNRMMVQVHGSYAEHPLMVITRLAWDTIFWPSMRPSKYSLRYNNYKKNWPITHVKKDNRTRLINLCNPNKIISPTYVYYNTFSNYFSLKAPKDYMVKYFFCETCFVPWFLDVFRLIKKIFFLILVYNYKSMMHHAMVIENQVLYTLLFS
jgi:hypothetical protein